MKTKKYSPTLYVYAPNRKTLYGAIPQPIHLKINYRFNTFSEMTFEIKKFYYNSRKGEWVKNPLYDKITKNKSNLDIMGALISIFDFRFLVVSYLP